MQSLSKNDPGGPIKHEYQNLIRCDSLPKKMADPAYHSGCLARASHSTDPGMTTAMSNDILLLSGQTHAGQLRSAHDENKYGLIK
jgi:hypothetical protein